MLVKIEKYPYSNFFVKLLRFVGAVGLSERFEGYLLQKRVKVKIDSYDTWNLDNTLAHIIVPSLKAMKEAKNGTPFVDFEDVPEHLRPEDSEKALKDFDMDGTVDDLFQERWEWALDEMIFSFECYKDDVFLDDPFYQDYDNNMKRVNHGTYLFGKYFGALWT